MKPSTPSPYVQMFTMFLNTIDSIKKNDVSFNVISGSRRSRRSFSILPEEDRAGFANNEHQRKGRIRFADEIEEVYLFLKDGLVGERVLLPPSPQGNHEDEEHLSNVFDSRKVSHSARGLQ